jgi:hypothetical protein
MASTTAKGSGATTRERFRDPGFLAYTLLRAGFTIAPILFGVDKFFNWMVEWPMYLWAGVADFLPGSPQQIMYGVGAIEIVAGLLVLVAPRIGAPLVALWLGAIVINLVMGSIFETVGERPVLWDIALRDVGLMMGAIALSLLTRTYVPAHRSGG